MQTMKEEVRQKILTAAREEFLRCGFEDASIRTIAASAKTAKSNVYNYYKDKDALFTAVLEPTVSSIRQGLEVAFASAGTATGSYTMDSQGEYMQIVVAFVATHVEDVSLLLFRAGGSSLAGFKGEVIDGYTDMLAGWFAEAMPGREPSRLFLRCVASFYVTSVEQMILERPSRQKAMEYMDEFLKFVYGGWSSVMKQENNKS